MRRAMLGVLVLVALVLGVAAAVSAWDEHHEPAIAHPTPTSGAVVVTHHPSRPVAALRAITHWPMALPPAAALAAAALSVALVDGSSRDRWARVAEPRLTRGPPGHPFA